MVSTPSAVLFILIYLQYVHVRAQLYLILCGSIDCLILCGSSVHDVFQARMLEWGAISYPRGSSQPRDQTCVFYVSPALAGGFFTTSTTWEDSPGKKLLKVYRAQAILKFPLCCIFYSVLLRDWKEALAFPAEYLWVFSGSNTELGIRIQCSINTCWLEKIVWFQTFSLSFTFLSASFPYIRTIQIT